MRFCLFAFDTHTELKLVTPPTTTTTPTPYIYTTAKPPRRKQHQNHNHKGHDTSSRGKEKLQPNNLQENEIVEAAAGGSIEGMYFICTKTVAPFTHTITIKTISKIEEQLLFQPDLDA